MQTAHLRFLAADHMLAAAHAAVSDLARRRRHQLTARRLFLRFLRTCERLELLHPEERRLLEATEAGDDDDPGARAGPKGEDRQLRVELARREKEAAQRVRALRAALARAEGAGDEEEARELEVLGLQTRCRGALRELRLIDEELPLLSIVEAEREAKAEGRRVAAPSPEELSSGQGLRVTTLSSVGGQLLRREELVKAVFEPRMSGPTVSLEEFAEREVAEARRRQEQQASAEAQQASAVRRHRHLQEAGLEDDEDLVDRATVNERAWDEWREENPRGSGNKLGKRF